MTILLISVYKEMSQVRFDSAFFEYWKRDDKEKNYQIAVQAATEYPGNMEYIEYSKQNHYHFTAPLFDRVSGEKPPTDSQTTAPDDFRDVLDNNTCFDPIRNTEAFQAFYE